MENLGVKYLKAIYRKHGENINDEVIRTVIKNLEKGKLMRSENMGGIFRAVLFDLSEEEKENVKKVEEEYNNKVCHVILRHTCEFGEEYTYIFAPKSEEELVCNVEHGWYYSLVSNNYCSELGDVGIEPAMGGLCKIW